MPERSTTSSKRRDSSARAQFAFGDVCLLLRTHAEHTWLCREVLPVLRELEAPGELPASQRDAARAYLEVVWEQALARARRSDDMRARLGAGAAAHALCERACSYHAGVRELRERLAGRVAALLPPARAPR